MQWKVVCIWQPVLTSSMIPPRRSFKALPKAKLAPKGHIHCLVVCCPFDTLQLSESQQNHHIWEACSAKISEMHQKLPCLQLALVNRTGPILLHHNAQPHIIHPTLQKLNNLGFKIWPRPPYSPNFSPTNYHFFKHLNNFLQGKCSHHQQEAEDAFQEFVESQSMDFYTTGINQLMSHWQKHSDYNGSYFV